MGDNVKETDTVAWKQKVQQDAIAAINGGSRLTGPSIEMNAPKGFDLPDEIKPRVVGDARLQVGLGN